MRRRNPNFAFVRGCLLSGLRFVVRTWVFGNSSGPTLGLLKQDLYWPWFVNFLDTWELGFGKKSVFGFWEFCGWAVLVDII